MQDLLNGGRDVTTVSLGPLDVSVLVSRKTAESTR
jgi:hypothetical protein